MVDPVLMCLMILDIVVHMKQSVANKQILLDEMRSGMVDYLPDSLAQLEFHWKM